mgnify:CR=1 FL=1
MVEGDLEELDAAEVGPVPVGRRHLREGLLEEPGPDAVGPVFRVLVLQGDDLPEDLLGALEPLGLAEAATGCWESPFDYGTQALLYVPRGLPPPKSTR